MTIDLLEKIKTTSTKLLLLLSRRTSEKVAETLSAEPTLKGRLEAEQKRLEGILRKLEEIQQTKQRTVELDSEEREFLYAKYEGSPVTIEIEDEGRAKANTSEIKDKIIELGTMLSDYHADGEQMQRQIGRTKQSCRNETTYLHNTSNRRFSLRRSETGGSIDFHHNRDFYPTKKYRLRSDDESQCRYRKTINELLLFLLGNKIPYKLNSGKPKN